MNFEIDFYFDLEIPYEMIKITNEFVLSMQAVSVLLADAVNPVKQALMENSVTQLAVFFGKLKGESSRRLSLIEAIKEKLIFFHIQQQTTSFSLT